MEEAVYSQLERIEDEHWWFRYRRKLVRTLLRRHHGEGKAFHHALDIGTGTGGNLPLLAELSRQVSGIEISAPAFELARKKHPTAHLLKGDIRELPSHFPEGSFDLVTDFGVLYHRAVANDGEALRHIRRALRPGGFAVFTEPAFPLLWREHDEQDHGRERYYLKDFARKVEEAGFELVHASYFNAISFLPALFLALLYRIRGRRSTGGEIQELRLPPPFLGWILERVMALELAWIGSGRSMPLGVSLVLVAKAPSIGPSTDAEE